MKVHANTRYSTERVLAALLALDAGASLKATADKYGMCFQYLHTLKKNRRRRTDAQAERPR